MKKILILLVFSASILRGQITPLYSIYREQTATINPAMPSSNYLISEYNNSIGSTYRYQWFGIEGAPVTQVVNWEWLPTDKNILVGAHIVNDKTGDIGLTSLNAQFAYKIALSQMDNRMILIGFAAGMQQYRTKLSEYAAQENINFTDRNQIIPELNMGVYYHHDNLFYVGLSAPQLLGNKIHFDSQADNHYFVKKVRQINAVGGGYIDAPFFGNDGAFLEPTIWLRYLPESKNVTFDLNLRAKVSNSFWAGAGYNLFSNTVNIETGSMLSESIGLDDGQLKIGFGFGIPLGSRWPGLGGIGEVNVSYSWK